MFAGCDGKLHIMLYINDFSFSCSVAVVVCVGVGGVGWILHNRK